MADLTELRAKLDAYSMPEPNTGCQLWLRSTNGVGYGKVCGFGDGVSRLAHRVAYEVFVGPIPPGTELDHLCRTPSCINPKHLEPVSHGVNVARGLAPAVIRRVNAARVPKTHCVRGHAFDEKNTHVTALGRRHCRACDALRHSQRRLEAR